MAGERGRTLGPRLPVDPVAAAFHPDPHAPLAPSGPKSRFAANIAAITTLHLLETEHRPATADEHRTLAAWSSWGAIPALFDERDPAWEEQREHLRGLLTEEQWAQARRTVLNAHYTDPRIVATIWDTVTDLGFEGGRVLEPGCGSGTFLGLAPECTELVGVELDGLTAGIAQRLYPAAEIRAESFVDTRYPGDWFDVTIGNVPFGETALHDPVDNANRHGIHNHFILKALRLTRPGGIAAVLTSPYTLDAANPGARREMNRFADLVGAVRLPTGAHRRTAGTDAVTDLLILRRRDPATPPADTTWEQVTMRDIDGVPVKINAYFDAHPEHILGTLTVGTGMHGSRTTHVHSDDLDKLPTQLRATLAGVTEYAHRHALHYLPRPEPDPDEPAQPTPTPVIPAGSEWDGTIHAREDGGFEVTSDTLRVPLAVPKSAATELRHLLRLRDAAVAQLHLEQATLDDTEEIAATRSRLLSTWQHYVARYGPINRFTPTSTGRRDDNGDPVIARRTPTAPRLLRGDPFGPLVFALEVFDDDTQQAQPAALLQHRVIVPRPQRLGADSPADALQITLDTLGHVDLHHIAGLLGDTPDIARERLGELVYDDPATGLPVHAPEYLSGPIHPKLDAARTAAASDPRFQVNVAALERVLPDPLTPAEITARIGAVWISPQVHEQFLRELLNDRQVTVRNPLPAEWQVRQAVRFSVRATQEWGTERRPAPDLFELVANQTPIRVDDTVTEPGGTKRTVFNPTETAAAQDKAQHLQERFEEWVWEDPARAATLAAEYNRRFNSIVLRDYATEAEYLTFPGMSATFELRGHQRAAVARIVSEPAVGLFHEVGAGKTAEMVAGAMELKRLGMVTKPAVVVPNHMLEQFSRDWLQIYPQARILAAGSDTLAGDARRVFVARVAANDWDAVILTRTAFQRLSLEPAAQAAFIDDNLRVLRDALEGMDGADRFTVKRIEKRIQAEEEKHKRLLDMPRDSGISFEATGIDYLIVDEAHDYKNLATVSRIPDANIDGSARAADIALKLGYLRRSHGNRVVTFATATPIANSVTEAHVMQRYLRPDLLRDAGLEAFDAWAATFGQTVTEVEMAPQGGGKFRVKTRFAKFQNVPEMLRLWHTFADVKTADDLDLPTPLLAERADGQRLPETVPIAPSPDVLDYVEQLGHRADLVASRAVHPADDNMLKISTDGRKVALDIRLIDPDTQPADVPLDVVADRIAGIHHATARNTYVDTRTGEPSPLPGALQLVFCDLSTPTEERWNAYHELRRKLVARGVPEAGVRFVHEARNDAEKARLFAAAREGRIRVLIGSTQRMGVGTNVQARAVALHDLDCPWRPADVAQRHGRILRQGNQNPEVRIFQYVVEHTFAAYMWQAIERKAKFIAQIMRGRLDLREIDDLPGDALSAAEAKALASGNPLLLERSVALNETAKLERLERAWRRNQSVLRATISQADRQIERGVADRAALRAALPAVQDLAGDRFRIIVDERPYTSRTDAAAAIARWLQGKQVQYARPLIDDRARGTLGQISGFPILARTRSHLGQVQVHLDLDGVPGATVRVPATKAVDPADIGLVRMLENRVAGIGQLITDTDTRITAATATRQDATRSLGAPFKYAAALTAAREELARVDQALGAAAEHPTPVASPATPVRIAETTNPAAPHTVAVAPTGGAGWSR